MDVDRLRAQVEYYIIQWNFMLSVRDALLHPPQISWTELFDHTKITSLTIFEK